MRLEIRNPKRIEEKHSLLPDFRFTIMSPAIYQFTSDWKGEQWRINLNRLKHTRRDKTTNQPRWNMEVECTNRSINKIIETPHGILSDVVLFRAYIAKAMGEIWKTYLNSVI